MWKKLRKRMQSFIGFYFVPTVLLFNPNYKRFAKLLYFIRIYVLLSCDWFVKKKLHLYNDFSLKGKVKVLFPIGIFHLFIFEKNEQVIKRKIPSNFQWFNYENYLHKFFIIFLTNDSWYFEQYKYLSCVSFCVCVKRESSVLRYEFPLCIWLIIVFKLFDIHEKVLEITMITNHDLEEEEEEHISFGLWRAFCDGF